MQTIPTDTTRPFFTQVTTLDGTDFQLQFRYNHRENCYYLNIALPDQTVLAQGIKIVSNYRLLQAYADDRMPPGELLALAQGQNDSPAQFGQLGPGQRVELTYFTQTEMAANKWDAWRERS